MYGKDAETGTTRTMYQFNGQVIAQRRVSGASNTLVYLHTDHLGSVSAATSSAGAMLSRQNYDPWGKVRPVGGGITQTKLNYTEQKLDDTGLLYYHSRYYDPVLGRFTSLDAMVAVMRRSLLTVSFQEGELLTQLNNENALRWEMQTRSPSPNMA